MRTPSNIRELHGQLKHELHTVIGHRIKERGGEARVSLRMQIPFIPEEVSVRKLRIDEAETITVTYSYSVYVPAKKMAVPVTVDEGIDFFSVDQLLKILKAI